MMQPHNEALSLSIQFFSLECYGLMLYLIIHVLQCSNIIEIYNSQKYHYVYFSAVVSKTEPLILTAACHKCQ